MSINTNRSYAVAAILGVITGIALNLPVMACCFCLFLPFVPVIVGVFDSLTNKFTPAQSNTAFVSAMKAGAVSGLALSIFMVLTSLVKLALGITIDLSQSARQFDLNTSSYSWITGIFGILICSSLVLVYFVVVSGVSGLVAASLSKKSA